MRNFRTYLFSAITIVGVTLLITVIAAVTPGNSYGEKPPSIQPVSVENTPLPISGTVGVNGPISAAQSGTWNVGIVGTPTVSLSANSAFKSADLTKSLGSFVGQVTNGFTEAVDADISQYKSVRVMTNCFAGGTDCGKISVNVYSIIGARSYLVDQFPMQNFVSAGRVYDVLGTTLAVQLQSSNAGAIDNIGVAVLGRAN